MYASSFYAEKTNEKYFSDLVTDPSISDVRG